MTGTEETEMAEEEVVDAAAVLSSCPVPHHLPSLLSAFPLLALDAGGGGGSGGAAKGRGLVLARDAAPGTVLASEAAFCWEVEEGEEGRSSPRLRWAHGLGHDPSGGGRSDAVGHARLLQMAPYAMAPGAAASSPPSSLLPLSSIAEATFRANSFAVRGEGVGPTMPLEGRALFSCICIANHSCAPTCSVTQGLPLTPLTPSAPPTYLLTVRDSRAHLVRRTGPASKKAKGGKTKATPPSASLVLPAGAEVSISYVPRAWPKARRQAALESAYGFTCTCPRCAAPYDDTRAARCKGCPHPDGRVYLSSSSSASSVCVRCGRAADASVVSRLSDEDLLAPLLDTPMAMDALVDALLDHPVLAHDDARLFTAMSQLLGAVAEQHAAATEGGDDAGEALYRGLYERLARAVAVAAMRSPFTSPGDLGIEVEE